MSLRRLLCCCGEDTSDDERNPMIPNEPEDLGAREIRTHGVIAGYPDESIDQPPAPSAVKTREQIEEELLNKILDRTQQQIIDVNNYDVYVEVNVNERRSQYDQLIEQHDASKCDPLPVSTLLENVGMDLTDVLQQQSITDADILALQLWNQACVTAVKAGFDIKCDEELVVHMYQPADDC